MDQEVLTTIAITVGVGLAAFVVKLVMKLAPHMKRKTIAPPPPSANDAPLAREDTGRFQLEQQLVAGDLGTRLDNIERMGAMQMRYFAKQSQHEASLAVLAENIDLICQIEKHRDLERAHAAEERRAEMAELRRLAAAQAAEIAEMKRELASLRQGFEQLPNALEERFLIHPKRR